MPPLHNIDVSIVTYPAAKKLPEFPHPDPSPSTCPPPLPSFSTTKQSQTDPASLQRIGSCVSVYIPSSPGTRFGIQYSINTAPSPLCYFYFKLLVNGRNVINWGTTTVDKSSLSITRALFEPDGRWHYKEQGAVLKREGIESRCFYFLPPTMGTSVANDGGLIEVQVFRSKGRKRRAPALEQHREQNHYGIISPSGGLLETPEDAHYYDWVLIDPKTNPFLSFRFHYRSWDNLRQLNLVPEFTGVDEPNAKASPVGSKVGEVDESANLKTQNAILSPATKSGSMVNKDREELVQTLLSRLEISNPEGTSSAACCPVPPRPLPEVPEKRIAPLRISSLGTTSAVPPRLPFIQEESGEEEKAELGRATQMSIQSNLRVGGKLHIQNP